MMTGSPMKKMAEEMEGMDLTTKHLDCTLTAILTTAHEKESACGLSTIRLVHSQQL